MSELYEQDTYRNKNIDKLISKVIIEYDLKSANTSLCREYNLLPIEKIEEIEFMPKDKRVKTIGKIMRKDDKFKMKLKLAFIDIRRRFLEENGLQSDDILCIKKDAIFCLREVSVTDFGYCHFSDKNRYTSYLYLNRFEFYYNPRGILDVKGIDDKILKKHDEYMNNFFILLFKHLETSSKRTLFGYIKRFVYKYKTRQLDVNYYREYDQESLFRLVDSDEVYDDATFIPYDNREEYLDIDYNFFNYILPIIKMVI